jgi:hypothetical protein
VTPIINLTLPVEIRETVDKIAAEKNASRFAII